MVTRCEVDMVEIKSKFLHTYGKTLGSFIKVCYHIDLCSVLCLLQWCSYFCFKGDTSGDYRKILLCVAGEPW